MNQRSSLQVRAENLDLIEVLMTIEMETRDGGQWDMRDVHEFVTMILTKLDKNTGKAA